MFSRFLGTLTVAVASVAPMVSCGPTSPYNLFPRTPAAGIDLQPLAPSLSASTKIYLPENSEFASHTVRWSNLEPPTPNVVIAPGTEDDVAKIVGSRCVTQFVPVCTTTDLVHHRSSLPLSATFQFWLIMVTTAL